jgi:hypothetical protein
MNDATIISLTTIIIGFLSSCLLYLLKICFKSKCDYVKCLCFQVKRNTSNEIKAEEMELQSKPNLTTRESINQIV